jgi:asparagine synthase (glutamine-hydrolysing)
MRFSIEGRVPFLDTELMRTLWALDDAAILSGGWNKRALRDATVDLLPSMVRHRRNKIGFTTPERAWFPQIAEEVREVLASPSFGSRPYWRQDAVVAAFDQLVAGRAASETMLFWRMLNTELWLRMFVDEDPTDLLLGTGQGAEIDQPARRTGPSPVPAPRREDHVAGEPHDLPDLLDPQPPG